MKTRTKIALATILLSLPLGGTLMATKSDTPTASAQVEKVEVATEQPAPQEETVAEQPTSTVVAPPVAPTPTVDPCIADKATALAPLQARIDETKATAQKHREDFQTQRGGMTEQQLDSVP